MLQLARRRIAEIAILSLIIITLAAFDAQPTQAASLRIGSQGAAVTLFQNILVILHYVPVTSVTGQFDLAMQKAVEQFQEDTHIVSRGSPGTTGYGAIGPKTIAGMIMALRGLLQTTYSTTSQPLPDHTNTSIAAATTSTVVSFSGGGGGSYTTSQPSTCTFNGTSIANGSSVVAYASSSAASCVSQVRTCSNGVLSGTFLNASCNTIYECLDQHTSSNEFQYDRYWLFAPSGSISTYFDATRLHTNLIEPYNASLYLIQMYEDNDQSAADGDLRFSTELWLKWYLAHVINSYSTTTHAITLNNGQVYYPPTSYLDSNGISHTYSSAEQSAVNHVFDIVSIPGAGFKYYTDTSGNEVPYFVFEPPYLAWPLTDSRSVDPLDRIYDSTDSYGALFITLANDYMQTRPIADATYFFQVYHKQLKSILNASIFTLDPNTHLTKASPVASGEYTMDNVEVWKGLESYLSMLSMIYPGNTLQSAAPFGDDGSLPSDEYSRYSSIAQAMQQGIQGHLQIQSGPDAGLYYNGWNPDTGTAIDTSYTDASNLNPYETMSLLFRNKFPVGGSVGSDADIMNHTFTDFKTYVPGYTSASNIATLTVPPHTWMFVPYAQALSNPNITAGMSSSELSQAAENFCEFMVTTNRDWHTWTIEESYGYVHLLRLLGR